MSDWHFGTDYDMWLYPPVDWTAPDYDYELPEPIEAANIEGELLVNAKDAIGQVRRLQAENAKLRELCASLYEFAMSEYPDGTELNFADRMRELGVEVSDD